MRTVPTWLPKRLSALAALSNSSPRSWLLELSQEQPVLEVKDFNLWYGPKQALHNVNMSVPTGKVTALVGPSGCGKTTTLRAIAGLEEIDSGDILIDEDFGPHFSGQADLFAGTGGFRFETTPVVNSHAQLFDAGACLACKRYQLYFRSE